MDNQTRSALEAARRTINRLYAECAEYTSVPAAEITSALSLIDAALDPPAVGLGSRYGGAIGRLLDGEARASVALDGGTVVDEGE